MSENIPAVANGALMSFIERASKDPEFDVAKFGELLRLQRDVMHDQARRAFNAAMSEAQSEMMPVIRDASNRHLGNKYARLETIDAALRPIYTHHGFSVRYGSAPAPREGDIRITCTVAHRDGYFEENHLDAPIATQGAQGNRTATTPVQAVGSAVTYLRRYLLTMVFNVVLADDEQDDDGEATRRSAASATPRGARVYAPDPEAAESFTANDRAWIAKQQGFMDRAQTADQVRRVEQTMQWQTALEQAPKPVADLLRAMAARAYLRVQPKAEEPPPPVQSAPEMADAGAGEPEDMVPF